jgi:hypothetical protein
VELGWYCALPGVPAAEADAFCGRLRSAGILGSCRVRGALARPLPLKIQVPLDGGAALSVGGSLRLSRTAGGGLAVGGGSCLRPELMRAARAVQPDPGWLASDGADNLVGPCDGAWRDLLAVQLAAADLALAHLAGALAEAAGVPPGGLRGEVWVRQLELCRDVFCPTAAAVTAEMAARPLPGAGLRRGRLEPRVAGAPVCVSWSAGAKRSPVLKVYPKCPELLRLEVCLRRREAVLDVHRRTDASIRGRCPLGGGRLGALMADLAEGAAPMLGWIGRLADEAAAGAGRIDMDGLSAALSPLLAVAAPANRAASSPGRPAGRKAAAEAQRALDELIVGGAFDARGMASSSATLRALRAMAAEGQLRAEPQRPRLFSVAPQHEAARRAVASGRRTVREVDDGEAFPELGRTANGVCASGRLLRREV